MNVMAVFRRSIAGLYAVLPLFAAALGLAPCAARAQNPFQLETSTNAQKIRLAAANFQPSADPGLVQTFNNTLQADLTNAGIFDMVSKSMEPQSTPSSQGDVNLGQWSAAPSSAAFVAFGPRSGLQQNYAGHRLCFQSCCT